MPPRKAQKTSRKATLDALPNSTAQSAASQKRKIDWSTIDEQEPFKGFTLSAATSNKRRKVGQSQAKAKAVTTHDADVLGYSAAPLSADIVQPNPFPEVDLSQAHYLIEPARIWESTKRYRKFTSK